MGLFKKKEEKPIGPYAKIIANVKYTYLDYYRPEIYFFDTEEDYINHHQEIADKYKDRNDIEQVIWNHFFRGVW